MEVLAQLRAFTYFPVSLAISADGLLAVTGSRGVNSTGGELRLWNLQRIQEEVKAARNAPGARKVDGAKLCSDRSVMFECPGHGEDVVGVAFDEERMKKETGGDDSSSSSCSIFLFSASKDGTARSWACPGFGAAGGGEKQEEEEEEEAKAPECTYIPVPANHAAMTALAALSGGGGAATGSSSIQGRATVVVASRGGLALL